MALCLIDVGISKKIDTDEEHCAEHTHEGTHLHLKEEAAKSDPLKWPQTDLLSKVKSDEGHQFIWVNMAPAELCRSTHDDLDIHEVK